MAALTKQQQQEILAALADAIGDAATAQEIVGVLKRRAKKDNLEEEQAGIAAEERDLQQRQIRLTERKQKLAASAF